MGGRGTSAVRNTKSESWRDKSPKYQAKTLGGVYFYRAESPFPSIDPVLYNRLPKYAQKSVVQLHDTGVSISGWFMSDEGLIYMNHTNSDFMYFVRLNKDLWRNTNGYNGDTDRDTIREITT